MPTRRRRFGRVRQLPSKRWQARYTGPDGHTRSAPQTFVRRSDAERWLSVAEADLARGNWLDPLGGEVTVAEWGERWLDAAAAHLKVKTLAGYRSLLDTKVLPRFGALSVAEVRPIMVGEWVASLREGGLSPSRIRQSFRLLSQVMKSAVDNDLIGINPCRGVKLPRMPQTEPHILSETEVAELIRHVKRPQHLLVSLLAYGGLRIGEVFALRRRSVDLTAGHLTVSESLVEISGVLTFDTPKSHQRRTLALPGFVIDELRDHLAGAVGSASSSLLFPSAAGTPFHYGAWRTTHFDPAVRAAGLDDVTPHDLRASHATWVAQRHGVMAAAQRLGHAHASVTTRHYARAVPGQDATVAAGFVTPWSPADGAREGHDHLTDDLAEDFAGR